MNVYNYIQNSNCQPLNFFSFLLHQGFPQGFETIMNVLLMNMSTWETKTVLLCDEDETRYNSSRNYNEKINDEKNTQNATTFEQL